MVATGCALRHSGQLFAGGGDDESAMSLTTVVQHRAPIALPGRP